jgi:hypothetical protein
VSPTSMGNGILSGNISLSAQCCSFRVFFGTVKGPTSLGGSKADLLVHSSRDTSSLCLKEEQPKSCREHGSEEYSATF